MNSYRDKIPEGYDTGQLSQFTPEMMNLFKQLFSYVSGNSPLGKMASGDQSYFDEMEAPALRQAGALQGNLASRFSGQGLGGRHSSGFQNTSSQSMNEFAQGLQSNRQNMMRQAIMDLMGISNSILGQRPYERFLVQEDQNGGNFMGGMAPLAGATLGGLAGNALVPGLGGIYGAQAGASIGSAASQGFRGR
jgi:hypothetical protein